MKKIKVDNIEIEVDDELTIMQACEEAGKEIPRFCYHDKLSVAGNCRMCLVEVEGAPKPVASCAMPINEGMSIRTNTAKVKKAREGVMEFLLINHPLDCPVCDQGGECDLQDQTVAYGSGHSRFDENKRAVNEKHMGPLIKTYMTRCIHCTRCIRFADEVAGVNEIGALNRGEDMEISTYLEKTIDSELSANIIDLCPVGALTSKPYQFEARPWELKKTETIDVMDAVGSNIRVDTYGWKVKRVLPRLNEDINEEWISDKTRYACDGLLTQRLDEPYIKENGKLGKVEWSDALQQVSQLLRDHASDEIAFLSGDLCDLETLFLFKKLSEDLNINNIECRQEGCNIPFTNRSQYTFNTKIADIEKSDCILIIGSNIRQEAPIINARIRKQKISTNLPIGVIGAKFDLTYEYEHLGDELNILSDLIKGKNNFIKKIKEADNPMLIIGNSVLNRKDSLVIFSLVEQLIHKHNFLKDDWNGYNLLQIAAARTGALDLGLYKKGGSLHKIYDGIEGDKIKLVISLGADEIDYEKIKKSKIVYIGTHGDKGANNADIILPSAAYTEKDSMYVNTEGRLQYAFKASFPPGNAKEDWKIINEISNLLELNWEIVDLQQLRSLIKSQYSNLFEFNGSGTSNYERLLANLDPKAKLCESSINYLIKDFYLTNAIARNSKTMAECSQARNELSEV
ncbi:NADH-quinone oxidoreductase subunit NuoG [Pelagibacteraceae bacterium]|nr:NADH-quinone oxidoreductase subunit NuoG [Pelagibacteraceae bacterium]